MEETKELGKLFEPIEIRGKVIRNRIVAPAQGTGFGNLDGTLSQRHIDYHRAKAEGGAGLIIFEHTGMDRRGSAYPVMEPLIDRDKFIPGFSRLIDAVHECGATIFVQLAHAGRRSVYSPLFSVVPYIPGLERILDWIPKHNVLLYSKLFKLAFKIRRQPAGPSTEPLSWRFIHGGKSFEYITPEKPRALTHQEIEEFIELHAKAAKRVKEAGADGVEVYGCHGYLISQFFSPITNRRTDEYGGDIEGRCRLAREVIRRVREEVGDDFIICFRIGGYDYLEGGATLEDAKALAKMTADDGVDVFNISGGFYGSYPSFVPPMGDPHGIWVSPAAEIRKVVGVPVIGGGRVIDPVHADRILAEGKVDMVIMGRALLADPDMPNKAREERYDEIRKCTGCNQCLELAEGLSMGIHCMVNPQLGREGELKVFPAETKKRVMIVGGGPGGMKAAEIAAVRGHEVLLYEKRPEIGGKLLDVAKVPGCEEFMTFVDHMKRRLRDLNIEIRNELATGETVKQIAPDTVIVATGSRPVRPDIIGSDSQEVVMMEDVFEGKVSIGKRILVYGDDLYCLSTAAYLACEGKEIVAFELPRFCPLDVMSVAGMDRYMRVRLAESGVDIVSGIGVKRVEAGRVMFSRRETKGDYQGFDTIVVCKLASDNALADQVRSMGIEVYSIGDAVKPRKSVAATNEGFEVACKI